MASTNASGSDSKDVAARMHAIVQNSNILGSDRHEHLLAIGERNWIQRTQPPLFTIPQNTSLTADEKEAAMRAAIEAGADVNEIDHEPLAQYNIGRPLNAVLRRPIGGGTIDMSYIEPLVELLLEYGADPRLLGVCVTPVSAAVVEAGRYAKHTPEPVEVNRPVYEKVYKRLKQVCDEMNGKDVGAKAAEESKED